MKKTIKIILIVGAVLITGLSIFYYFTIGRNVVQCSPFNEEQLIWLPYHKNDTIIFTSNNIERKYLVQEFDSHYTESYRKNCKCGACEQGVKLLLKSNLDSIAIEFDNYNNFESVEGFEILIDDSQIHFGKRVFLIDSILVNNNYLIRKSIGLMKFTKNDSLWQLKR